MLQRDQLMKREKHSASAAFTIGLRAFRMHPLIAISFLAATLVQGALQGLLVWALREVLLALDKHGDGATTITLGAALIFAIWVARAGTAYVAEVLSGKLAYGAEVETSWSTLSKLLTLPVRYFDKNSQGDLVMATYSDVGYVRQTMLAVGNVFLHVTRLLGLVAVAWMMSPKLTVIGLMAVPVGAWPALLLGERIKESGRRQRRDLRSLYDSFLQVSAGIRIIKVNSSEERVMERAREVGRRLIGHMVGRVKDRGLARFLLESVSGIGLIVVLVVGGRDVAAGTLSWQSLLSLLIAVMGVYAPTVGLLQVYVGIQASLPFLNRIEEIMRTAPTVQERPDARPLHAAPQTIEFRDVSFSYEGTAVLKSVSAKFAQGETIGIVGPSGAGKSTLLSLLLRLYDPTEGQLLFDGVDAREFRAADYMRQCALVMQEPFLFLDTVAENIRAARPGATMDDVIEAAEAAGIHDEIMQMEQGYDTILGNSQDGRGVSTGQKQRICIAAALLKNAPLLFLDEATSNLDSLSERRLQAAIERLMRGRTTFVIAHRLSTLRSADRIMVIDQGEVIALGRHEDLLESCSLYRRLWMYQMHDSSVSSSVVVDGSGSPEARHVHSTQMTPP